MLHIIDANNLAGKLDLLDRRDFDIVLIDLIKEYSQTKKFILVFDSTDPMGDKKVDNNVTIIYAPRDSYYRNADDKIIEIVLNNKDEDLRVITDDIEIKEKIKKINLDEKLDIELEQASDFAERLEKHFEKDTSFYAKFSADKIDNKEELSDDEVSDINEELMKIWKD